MRLYFTLKTYSELCSNFNSAKLDPLCCWYTSSGTDQEADKYRQIKGALIDQLDFRSYNRKMIFVRIKQITDG